MQAHLSSKTELGKYSYSICNDLQVDSGLLEGMVLCGI